MAIKQPLVSFCLLSYNKAQYVAEAVRGALAQTYEPLEIIIIDDCSTDGSDAIINNVLKEWREGQSYRRNVVYVVNEYNLGLVRNAEKIYGMARGEILIQAGCDDISCPQRVQKIMEAWINDGCRALTIGTGSVNIDIKGTPIGFGHPFGCWSPHGAVMAWHREVMVSFPPVSIPIGYDDEIFAFRARLLAHLKDTKWVSDLYVPDRLVIIEWDVACRLSIDESFAPVTCVAYGRAVQAMNRR